MRNKAGLTSGYWRVAWPSSIAGQPYRMAGSHTDITEKKQSEHQLKAVNSGLADANEELEQQKAELEAANAHLEALATTDGLTRLKNHGAFQDRLREEYERGVRYHSPLSVVLLDVDRFKHFNDTYGHPAGDTVLKQVADILQREARSTDVVARYGGEEFVVLLPETDAERCPAGGGTDAGGDCHRRVGKADRHRQFRNFDPDASNAQPCRSGHRGRQGSVSFQTSRTELRHPLHRPTGSGRHWTRVR